jgi:hypothetical protein
MGSNGLRNATGCRQVSISDADVRLDELDDELDELMKLMKLDEALQASLILSFLCLRLPPYSSALPSPIALHVVSPRNMTPNLTFPEYNPGVNLETSPPSFASLPPELLVEVAEQLAASHSLGTLASFNAVSQQLRTISHDILYRSLILVTRDPDGFKEREKDVMIEEGMAIPEGWKFTK